MVSLEMLATISMPHVKVFNLSVACLNVERDKRMACFDKLHHMGLPITDKDVWEGLH